MSPLTLALISATPPTFAAICALFVGWLNHRQGKEIHVLVNSNLAKVQAELAIAQAEIISMRALITALLPKTPEPPTPNA